MKILENQQKSFQNPLKRTKLNSSEKNGLGFTEMLKLTADERRRNIY